MKFLQDFCCTLHKPLSAATVRFHTNDARCVIPLIMWLDNPVVDGEVL